MRISHLCALIFLCFGTAHAAPKAAPVVVEPLPEKDGLKVSIGSIELRPSDPHINVVLQNTSDKPINIFNDGNSWGFNNLTLEVREVDGKVLTAPLLVARDYVPWRGNVLSFQTIESGEAIVREVRLQVPQNALDSTAPITGAGEPLRRGFYGNFPAPIRGSRSRITMRAVFGDSESITYEGKKAWTGAIASPFKGYNVYWDAD